MEYGRYATLDDLLRDGDAVEFRAIVCEIPVTLSKEALFFPKRRCWSGASLVGAMSISRR
jgi:hypothetical protein